MPRLAAAGRGVLFDTADMKRNGGSKAKSQKETIGNYCDERRRETSENGAVWQESILGSQMRNQMTCFGTMTMSRT